MGDRTTSDVRALRDAQAKPPNLTPTPPGQASVAYGIVMAVDGTATPPIHTVMFRQGPAGGWSGNTTLCVAVGGATLAVDAEVRLMDVPGVGYVAERIAPQDVDAATLAQHQHSSNADGGLAAFLGGS